MAFRIFSKTAAPQEHKQQIPLGVIGISGLGRAVWGGRSDEALTRSGFLNNPIGFRAVKMISEASASIALVLQDQEVRYETHPLLELLRRPNPHQGQSAFFEALYGQLCLTGDAYIETIRDEEGIVHELHLLRSDRMRVLPGRDGWPAGFEYAVGNKKTRLPFENVLHLRSYHPLDDHYGLSPLHAAGRAIEVHNAASDWSKALLDNAARPSGALVYRGPDGYGSMSDSQYERLVDEIENNHQGAKNAGRPLLLEGGLDWKPMGFSPSDMEFHRTKEAAAREIALALGVPPMLLGIPGDNTYSNYQEANRAFYRLTVLPLVGHVATELSHWLSEDKDLCFRADLDRVAALSVERESDWRRIGGADFLSEGEKRRLLGFPSEKGD